MRARIREKGAIPFAEFQAVALYWPNGGYYTRRGPFGVEGDFYTAPHLHPAFGALLSRQLTEAWRVMGTPEPFWVVEMGAGSGRLAADVTGSLLAPPADLAQALRYLAVDLVEPPQPLPKGVQWIRANDVPVRRLQGCVLANEFLDALPVHRVTVQQGRLRELFVTIDEQGFFTEVAGEPSTPALGQRLETLGIELPEGYRTEINLALEPWLRRLSEAMDRGYVVIIDYGHEAPALYHEQRNRGTLRCYYRHTLNANPYQHVGEQDISVHVDFTSVRQIAESLGFTYCGYTTQAEFLTNLGWATYRQDIASRPGLAVRERRANLRALDTLVDPEGMGQFKVMVLGKDVAAAPLQGFTSLPPGSEVPWHLAPGSALLASPGHVPWQHVGKEEPAPPSWKELLS